MAIPRVGIDVSNKADLVSFNSAVDAQTYTVYGDTLQGDSTPRFYYYSVSSVAIPDGEKILAATGMGGTGRYIKTAQIPGTAKRQEVVSGTTNGSGNYTVTFASAYPVAPNIQPCIIGATNTQSFKITAVSTTGFTVNVINRTDALGLLPSYAAVSGAVIEVLVTEK